MPWHGYYYAPRYHKLARLKLGDKLPRHMRPWEFVARDDEGSTSEILQRLRERHPDLDPYRLSYATSTPVDPSRLVHSRGARRRRYLFAFSAALAVSALLVRILLSPGKSR